MAEWRECKGRRSKKIGVQQTESGPTEDLLDYTCDWLPLHHSLTPEDCDGCIVPPLVDVAKAGRNACVFHTNWYGCNECGRKSACGFDAVLTMLGIEWSAKNE